MYKSHTETLPKPAARLMNRIMCREKTEESPGRIPASNDTAGHQSNHKTQWQQKIKVIQQKMAIALPSISLRENHRMWSVNELLEHVGLDGRELPPSLGV